MHSLISASSTAELKKNLNPARFVRFAMSEPFNAHCSISQGPNLAFVVVSFTANEAKSSPETLFFDVRQAVREAIKKMGLDFVRLTFLIPPGVHPSWALFWILRTKLNHLRFEFPSNKIDVECAPTTNFMSFSDRMVAQCMCFSLGITWCSPISRH